MSDMFQWKEYVFEVYKERSFTKAAQNLFISQPSLSARIKKIETELGTPLFDRSTAPLKLTEAGEMYIESAEEISQIEQRMTNYLDNLRSLKTGNMTIGTSTLFAACVLPPLITEFKQKYPDIHIRVIEGNTISLEDMIEKNDLDFVIDNYKYDHLLYSREYYKDESILLAVPRDLPVNEGLTEYQLPYESIINQDYGRYKPVPLESFADYPFIMLSKGNDTRERGTKLCQRAGFQPNIMFEFNQQLTSYMAATTNLGITFISDMLVGQIPNFDNMVHYKLNGEEATRNVYFYYKNHRNMTLAMKEFLSLVKNR